MRKKTEFFICDRCKKKTEIKDRDKQPISYSIEIWYNQEGRDVWSKENKSTLRIKREICRKCTDIVVSIISSRELDDTIQAALPDEELTSCV